jgi:hypothetical protein
MQTDLLKLSIVSMDIDDLTPDILASYNMMIKHDSFKKYHGVINEKLKEYNDKNKKKEIPVKGIKIEPKVGDFYKTVDGSIVVMSGFVVTANLYQFVIIKDENSKNNSKLGCMFVTNNEGIMPEHTHDENFGFTIASKLEMVVNEEKMEFKIV